MTYDEIVAKIPDIDVVAEIAFRHDPTLYQLYQKLICLAYAQGQIDALNRQILKREINDLA